MKFSTPSETPSSSNINKPKFKTHLQSRTEKKRASAFKASLSFSCLFFAFCLVVERKCNQLTKVIHEGVECWIKQSFSLSQKIKGESKLSRKHQEKVARFSKYRSVCERGKDCCESKNILTTKFICDRNVLMKIVNDKFPAFSC